MITKTGARTAPLTPALVATFCQLPPLPGEREIRKGRILLQRGLIAAGQYRGVVWAEALDKSTGTRFRANGQHSSAVLSNLDGLRFPTHEDGSPLTAIIEEWEMDDAATEGLRLFDAFDPQSSARTIGDRMTMVRASYPDIRHLRSSFLVSVVNAVEEHHRKDPGYQRIDSRYRGEELLVDDKVREFAKWLAPFSLLDNGDFIRRTKAMAVCFENWLTDKPKAMQFWGSVFNEDDPDANAASRKLADELKSARVRQRRGDRLRLAATQAWRRFTRP